MLVDNNNPNNSSSSSPPSSADAPAPPIDHSSSSNKRKRRPAGTPDPDAEVVSLSPRTLLESDRYVCEICNQGFQRDQNLQMHRRRHKVPWKLLKRETPAGARKRVYVCPEPTCLHHDPCHALGDLVGIKKHFRRKHSSHKQWVCGRCSKAYAVQSDYKAHLKTCGTRGHSCDCGRVFSRVESFIEHQDACQMGRLKPDHNMQQRSPVCLSRTGSNPSGSVGEKHGANDNGHNNSRSSRSLELQLLPSSSKNHKENAANWATKPDQTHSSTQLQLSIGSSSEFSSDKTDQSPLAVEKPKAMSQAELVSALREESSEELRQAMEEKAYAEEARREARRQVEMAEREYADAKRIRQHAQGELQMAHALREQAMKETTSALLDVTCHACKAHFQAPPCNNNDQANPQQMSYVSTNAIFTAQDDDDNETRQDHDQDVIA